MKTVQFSVDEVAVAGNSSMIVTAICEKGAFRLRELLLTDPDVIRFFMIDDVKIGKNSQFCSDASVPARFFEKSERQQGLYYDTLPRGLRFGICVTNISDLARTFKGVMSGDLVDLDHHERPARLATESRHILGLGLATVSPRSKLTVRTQAHVIFKPETMFVPAHVLDGIRVNAVRVVGEDILRADEELEILVGEQAAFRSSPTMQIADWLCIDVENLTDTPKLFCGAIVGVSTF